jgi:hypothetical protein
MIKVRIVVFAATIIAATANHAFSHDWYPPVCCSDKDCREISNRDVDWTPAGWLVKITGEVIPEGKTHSSPDGKFHWCERPADASGPAKTRCLFVPGEGT